MASDVPYSAVPRREGDLADPNAVREVFGSSTPDLSLGDNLPPGAARPRFLGRAAGEGDLGMRHSYADSSHSGFSQAGSEHGGSVYGLNPNPYSDDPNAPSRFSNYYDEDGVPMRNMGASRNLEEKRAAYSGMAVGKKSSRARWALIISAVLIVLILIIVVPVYFAVIKPKADKATGSTGGSSGDKDGSSNSNKPAGALLATSGSDGSNVIAEDGTTFAYQNSLGGSWYYDMNDPWNNNAQAQTYTPALNASFEFGKDKVYGVNIGGWLVTEPFIVPALYQKYSKNSPPPVDEWTLMEAMGDEKEKLMKEHYETFITEKDFAAIAAAGLNFVRIPIGWWAIETRGDEPFPAGLSWPYFLKAIGWARKYGLRINLDLHALPGSQNGWNHSGRFGTQNFLLGPMGLANAQRGLDYIRILAEFISQDQYKDVVVIFGITNEPQGTPITQDTLGSYYVKAYEIVRAASGSGEGKGPWVSLHDGFFSRDVWKDFLAGADRVQLDDHPYLAFGGQTNAAMSTYATTPCQSWGSAVNTSMADFGMTHAGEWSNAVTDCGLFLNGVNQGIRYEGDYKLDNFAGPKVGSCAEDWTNWEDWSDGLKKDYKNFAMGSMDALGNWFFWTWKIGKSAAGRIETPHWDYSLGLENGWMPKDPREARGYCKNSSPFTGKIAQSSDGGVDSAAKAKYPWPPASIASAGPAASLPQYTATGTLVTLSGATPSITGSISGSAAPTATAKIDIGSGWKNPDDKDGMMVEISGCSYLDPWVGPTVAVPPTC